MATGTLYLHILQAKETIRRCASHASAHAVIYLLCASNRLTACAVHPLPEGTQACCCHTLPRW